MGKNIDNKKIFQDAAKAAAKDIQKIIVSNQPIHQNDIDTAISILEDEEKDWNELRKAIDGRYAKKFMDLLDNLPDREFIRSYLKVLEYVKPKITRKEELPAGDIDNSITIQIVQLLPDGKQRIIELKEDATLLQDGE